MKVVTTEGTTLEADRPDEKDHKKRRPMTEAEAETRCAKANAQAEALGITTRYEVRP